MMQRWSRVAVFAGVLALFASMAVLSQAQEGSTPRVWSMVSTPTDGPNVSFVVTFNEPVTGVDVTDFRVLGSETAYIQEVYPTDAADVYTVMVGHASTAADILVLLIDDDSIVNATNNPLGGLGSQNGNFSSIVTTIPGAATGTDRTVMGSFATPRTPSKVYGTSSSMQITSEGTAVIAYNEDNNRDLKFAICESLLCANPTVRTIATANTVGDSISMRLTAADIPLIAYSEYSLDRTTFSVKLAVCNDSACTNPTISTINTGAYAGAYVSMALNSADFPVISYYDSGGSLTLALCNTITCAFPVKRILDNFGTSGSYNSLALTSADVPIVSYHDDENENLKLAVCADTACATNTVSIIASTGIVGWYPSLVITTANVPIISYFDLETLDLKLAVCNNTACTSPTSTTLDSEGSVGLSPSMALTTTDLPIITYQGNGSLKIALCNVTSCTSPTISILDSSGFTGRFTSLALTAENRPIISYTENTDGSLRYILGAVTIDQGQPDSFTKSAPNNTTTITSSSIALSWTASVGATSYEYCVAILTMPCTTWNSTGTSTSHTVTALVPGTTYQWQVRANNDAGTTLANTSIPWQFKVQNAASNVYGTASSMKVTSTGTAVIAYNEDNNRDLKFAICESLICANPTVRTIATANTVGDSISMSLTSADIPLIAFSEYSLDRTIFSVKLAVCNDTACTNPTISTINTGASAGAYVSMALNSADIPVISYYDSGGSLTLALCNTITCALPVKRILDNFGTSGSYNSLALTSADVPIVSYHDDDEENLKLAVCADIACATNTVSTIARTGIVGWYPSLVITTANVPIISYLDLTTIDLKLAVCNNTACTSPTVTTLDSEGAVGLSPSMTLTTTDLPIITYQGNGSLKIALCDITACTSPTISILDSSGFTGRFTSLALTNQNRPIISYTEKTDGSLMYILGAVPIDRGLPNSFVKTAPGTPTITTSSVVLGWNAADGATSYEYCIALSAAACTTWNTTGTATIHTVADLVHGATYHWQVRARNDVGTTLANSSALWQFTVALPPTSFAKTSPANNAINQKTSLVLSWAASTRATSYEYCVALTTATCTKWKSTGSARTATVSGLLKGKSYYWQVRAVNSGGSTPSASTFWKFTTAR